MRAFTIGRFLPLFLTLFLLSCTENRKAADPSPPSTWVGALVAPPQATYLQEFTSGLMQNPNRIAVSQSGDFVVVSDARARLVHVFGSRGTARFSLSVDRPLGVAVRGDDNIYVGNEQDGSVTIYDIFGAPTGTLGRGAGEFAMPSDIAWDPVGDRVIVTDSRNDSVKIFSPVGTPLFAFGGSGTSAGLFQFPTGVVFDPLDLRFFVADHTNARVQVFDNGGAALGAFGSYGSDPGQFVRIQGLAVDAVKRLYAVDAFQGRLQIFDSNGIHLSYLGQFGNLQGQLNLPLDAAVDPFNRLLVTSYNSGKVVVFGIDNYTVPTESLPVLRALVSLSPSEFTTEWPPVAAIGAPQGDTISASIEVPNSDAANIMAPSVRLEGVAPVDGDRGTLGDVDNNQIPDLTLRFKWSEIVANIQSLGSHKLKLAGDLTGGYRMVGTADITLFGRANVTP